MGEDVSAQERSEPGGRVGEVQIDEVSAREEARNPWMLENTPWQRMGRPPNNRVCPPQRWSFVGKSEEESESNTLVVQVPTTKLGGVNATAVERMLCSREGLFGPYRNPFLPL